MLNKSLEKIVQIIWQNYNIFFNKGMRYHSNKNMNLRRKRAYKK